MLSPLRNIEIRWTNDDKKKAVQKNTLLSIFFWLKNLLLPHGENEPTPLLTAMLRAVVSDLLSWILLTVIIVYLYFDVLCIPLELI